MNSDGETRHRRHEWPRLIGRATDLHQSVMDFRLDRGVFLLAGDGHKSTKYEE